MTYGGGKYSPGVYSKKLPGVYTHTRSEKKIPKFIGVGGVVALPLDLDWGPENEVVKVSSGDFFGNALKLFGVPAEDPKLLPLSETFLGGAKEVLVYRLNAGGEKAKTATTIDEQPVEVGQIATARHAGIIGNKLSTAVLESLDDNTKYEVQTLMDGVVIDKQFVSIEKNGEEEFGKWDDLKDNCWIVWNRIAGGLIPHESTPLVGGTNGEAATASASKFRQDILKYDFDTVAWAGTAPTESKIFASWCRSMEDDYGIKFRLVAYNTAADDYRVINVTTKAKGANEAGFVYFTAGLDASARPGQSNTNRIYTGSFELDSEPTQEGLEKSIDSGEFVYHTEKDRVCVLVDLNSFVGISDEKNAAYQKPNTIRCLDFFEKQVSAIFKQNFLGKVPLDQDGLDSLKGQILSVGAALVSMRAFKKFDTSSVTLTPIGVDAVHALYEISLSGVMEKLYLEGVLR